VVVHVKASSELRHLSAGLLQSTDTAGAAATSRSIASAMATAAATGECTVGFSYMRAGRLTTGAGMEGVNGTTAAAPSVLSTASACIARCDHDASVLTE
jgi:hypothetical protein